jgi:hypothetical protein
MNYSFRQYKRLNTADKVLAISDRLKDTNSTQEFYMYGINLVLLPTRANLNDFVIYAPPAFVKSTIKKSSSVT